MHWLWFPLARITITKSPSGEWSVTIVLGPGSLM